MPNFDSPVLVTGATGFIGRRLVAQLLDEDVTVRALALPQEDAPLAWGDRVEVIRGDVRKLPEVERAVDGAAAVFHLAALVGATGSYEDHWTVTVEGSRNVYAAAAANAARVIVTTSICAYGDRIARDVCREDGQRGAWQGPYGRAKQGQEDAAIQAQEDNGLAVTIVRPANVYGVGSGPWVEGMLALIAAGAIAVVGEGSGNAGLVHVDNVADALRLLLHNNASVGRTYNVCDGLDVTWRGYMDDLCALVGAPALPSVDAHELRTAALQNENLKGHVEQKEFSVFSLEALNLVASDNRFDTARIREDFGWTPRVSYETGLAQIAADLAAR